MKHQLWMIYRNAFFFNHTIASWYKWHCFNKIMLLFFAAGRTVWRIAFFNNKLHSSPRVVGIQWRESQLAKCYKNLLKHDAGFCSSSVQCIDGKSRLRIHSFIHSLQPSANASLCRIFANNIMSLRVQKCPLLYFSKKVFLRILQSIINFTFSFKVYNTFQL